MEDELLNLKWGNHKTTFIDILKILRKKSNYTDATLAVEDKFYPVHKLVISTCSEYFGDIFERTPCKSPVIVLKDVRSHDIEALLDYMYLGEVNVKQSDLDSLLKTAECLRIKGLAVPCEDSTNICKNSTSSHVDARRGSPPPKRRRHDSSTVPSHTPPVPSPQITATALVNPPHTLSMPPHSTSNTEMKVEMDEAVFNTEQHEPVFVKVEVDDTEEQDENFRTENNYDGDASNVQDPGWDYGSDYSKTEYYPENYDHTSFPGPSLQQNESTESTSKAPKIVQKVNRKPRGKTSPIWKHCTLIQGKDGNIMKCNYCAEQYVYTRSSTTSNILTHMRRSHSDTFQERTESTSKTTKVVQKVNKKPRGKTSPIWKHCTLIQGKDGNIMKCNYCEEQYVYTSTSTTSNILKHMRRSHSATFQERNDY